MDFPQFIRPGSFLAVAVIIGSLVFVIPMMNSNNVHQGKVIFDSIMWDKNTIVIHLKSNVSYMLNITRLNFKIWEDNVSTVYNQTSPEGIYWIVELFYRSREQSQRVFRSDPYTFAVNITYSWVFSVTESGDYYFLVNNNIRCAHVHTAQFHIVIQMVS